MSDKTALRHAMINDDAIASEFCQTIGLHAKFGALVPGCGFGVKDANGASYPVPLSVLDYDGTAYIVPNDALDRDGSSYTVI